jgi:hypothetical protein
MPRIVTAQSFRYTPCLTGGNATVSGFNPSEGRGWHRATYQPAGQVQQIVYRADSNMIYHSGFALSRFSPAGSSPGMAGKAEMPSPHMARMTALLVDNQGWGRGLINRDLRTESYRIEITMQCIMPKDWPTGGTSTNTKWKSTCLIGFLLFAPPPTGGSNDYDPSYQLYWIRHSSSHPTKPGTQEI